MSHTVFDPLEVLRRLGGRFRPTRIERTPAEEALGRYLAGPLEVPGGRRADSSGARATVNGYVLPRGVGAGEHPFSLPPSGPGEGGLRRVESGELLPPDAERVIPVEWTEVLADSPGRGARVRIAEDALPPPGFGMAPLPEEPLKVEPGTRLDGRLLGLLLARGVLEVETCAPERIGVLTFGGELTDVLGEPPGPASARDLTGFWLPPAIRALGLAPLSLGIAGDGLTEGREALLRAHQRKLRTVIAAGGLGDGLEDRTLELMVRIGARIHFDRVAIRPGRSCLLAEWMDMKILVLSGRPLDASVGFDLFGRPALLLLSGAPAERWDWSRRPFPPTALSWRAPPREPAPGKRREARDGSPPGGLWRAVPVAESAAAAGWTVLSDPEDLSPFLPWIPGSWGWAILPPPSPGGAARVYFQPSLPETGRSPRASGPSGGEDL